MSELASLVQAIFGGDAPEKPLLVGQIAARAFVVYLLGLVLIRVGKSRLLGRYTPLDVILGIVLGSLLSRAITGSASISGTSVSCAVLVAMHWLITRLSCRWHRFGNLAKGHCKLLVENGQIHWDAMRESHISEQDLMEELRLNANLEDLSRIEKAYKERSGQISGVRRVPESKVVELDTREGVRTVRIEVAVH